MKIETQPKPVVSRKRWKRHIIPNILILTVVLGVLLAVGAGASAVTIEMTPDAADGGLGTMQLLFIFVLIALAPSLLIMMTSFTRIVIVFSFLRNAIGLQQTPPNQVVIGLSLFLSLFIMQPVLTEINTNAIEPFIAGEITQDVALDKMQTPIKIFMLKETNPEDLNLFVNLSGEESKVQVINPETLTSLGLQTIVPAFITSELKKAFEIGFLLYLPFLVIDMVVSSTLMSMGMVMLPPSMISLPFKLMLFVVVNGWSLLMEMLVRSFM